MKARVIATGKIIEVKEEYDLREAMPQVFYSNVEDPYEVYEKEELDFDIEGKFTENCLNGIKQGTVYDPDYWTRFEHQAAIAAMQGMLNNSLLITGLLKVNKSHEDIVDEVTGTAIRYAHTLVEKYQKEEK